jgi:nucleoside-diphosphate-sugar epimerase
MLRSTFTKKLQLNQTQFFMKTISILGCGWLGLPLAEHLLKEGFAVKGSVSRSERIELLKQKGIIPWQIQISDTTITGENLPGFLASETLIINFPPARREDIVEYHTAQMKQLINEINKSTIKHILFISSTSVYPELNRTITETDNFEPTKGSGKALIAVEQLLLSQTKFKTTIIRFAGLIGYDRQPGRFLSGKKNIENGNGPVNVIHQDDCILIISKIIQENVWGEIFNACSDIHPTRQEFYTLAAEKIALPLPEFISNNTNFKIINSDKIKSRLDYSFKYPNPLETL